MEQNEILNRLKRNSSECVIQNRRHSLDFLFKFIKLMSFFVWCFIFSVILICEEIGVRIFDINQSISEISNIELFNATIKLIIATFGIGLVLCIIALIRARRKSDEILKKSLMVSECVVLILGIFLLLKYI